MKKETIISDLKELTSELNVITDLEILKQHSADRFRKFETIFGEYTRPIPVAVVKAQSTEEIAEIIKYCNEHKLPVIAKTGGSSIEGGLETALENTVVIDGSEMNNILNIDTYNMQVTCECGVCLEDLEEKLRKLGYTTGHSPQSKPLAQMGGLVATRSIGQFSTLYGGIEDMIVGMEMVMADGSIARIKNTSRRAAGPDIRHIPMGSEGALCYITEVTVKIFKYMPENNKFYSWLLNDMKTGFEILREVMVQGYKPSFARLYDFEDGEYYFSHFCEGKPVLIFMAEGPKSIAEATGVAIEEIVSKFDTYKKVDENYIIKWYAGLNWHPGKITEEYEMIEATKNVGFTTEISANWSNIYEIYEAVITRIKNEIPDITMVGGHSSHSYINGTNLYFMYYYNVVDCAPTEEINKYHNPINAIIVEETLKRGGSMCHHHGVGKYRVQWIKEEHGTAYPILKKLKEAFDPNNIMNPGTVVAIE
ncbi:FAD-binding oxidoreductase [Candidatus Epulonipiscium viviparus]|uniref:FAD-binding oxidoreductase n=1 Tax=Candidatus Epulonipiscium viviparus TaxID=420336 RepID=UPI00016C09E2|nr:FAD-binding oxidoreductase [Candidatus Epulopiscium viviparus]